jgi:hypothetical protein
MTRPYKLFGGHERAAVSAAVEDRVNAWAAVWLPQNVRLRVESAPAVEQKARFDDADASRWTRVAARAGEWLAMIASENALQEVGTAVCGDTDARTKPYYSGYSQLAAEIADTALRHLAAALLGAPSAGSSAFRLGEAAAPGADVWAAGSGALALRFGLGGAVVDFVSSPEWTLRLLAQSLARPLPATLSERRKGIAERRVELRAVAGWVDLDVRALQNLEVGNVIATDTRIDQAMTLVVASASLPAVCSGRLGSSDGGRAVVLSALRP